MEGLGPPLPVPTDASIVFAGTTARRNLAQPFALFVALSPKSAVGGYGSTPARGGAQPAAGSALRALYVHLEPERAEALLARSGRGTFGRAGLR